MKKNICLFLVIISFLFISGAVFAEQKIDYKGQPAIDSDLDGLTDEGEKQIYHTDPNNPDTDGDGILDGAEVISKTEPLNASSPQVKEIVINNTYPVAVQPAWPWYLVRSGGLMAFLLLYLSILFGLAIRLPVLRRIISPVNSMEIHQWISLQALIFTLIHSISTLWDRYINFSLKDVFVPFASSYNPGMVALGTIGLYLMIALIATSYLRRFISHDFWRAIHSLNFFLYAFAFIHALNLGTDLKSGIIREIFIYANVILFALLVISIFLRIVSSIRNRRIIYYNQNNEDIRENQSKSEKE